MKKVRTFEEVYENILRSSELICKVIYQRILKGQQINAISYIDELHDLYEKVVGKFGILDKLNHLLIDHYKELLDICNDKHYSMTVDKLEIEIKFLEDELHKFKK